MRFIFRADASPVMGVGHIMRCASIAEEASSQGIECILVGEISGVNWLSHEIQNLGFARILSPSHVFENFLDDVLVIDSYKIDVGEEFIQPESWRAVAILADPLTPNFRSRLVIHPGFDGNWYKNRDQIFRFGPDYIPLRRCIRNIEMDFLNSLRKIVVYGGGTDPYGFAPQIANLISRFPDFESAVFFTNEILGIEQLDPRFSGLPFSPRLQKELETADLVFTTASTSSFEVIGRGIPLGVVAVTENQYGNYRYFETSKIAAPIGHRNENGNWILDESRIHRLINDSTYREYLSANEKLVFDLQGAKRIVDELISI